MTVCVQVCVCVLVVGRGCTYREMLEQPRPHDVRGHLGENATLFLPLLILVRIIVVPCAGRRDAVV